MKPLSQCRLYTFVDMAYSRGRSVEDLARALCDGGSDLIQLRAKELSADAVRSLGDRLLKITESAGVGLVINDHWEIAKGLNAPVCHLGQEDFFDAGITHVDELRGESGPLLGLSTHAPFQAERAVKAGADYIAIGPVYPTGTKPTAPAVTLEYVRWASRHISLPWFAIGGINESNVEAVLEAGATRICVVSAILNSTDVARACARFRRRLAAP